MIPPEPPSDPLTPTGIKQLQDVLLKPHLDDQLNPQDEEVILGSSSSPDRDSFSDSTSEMDRIEIKGILSYGYTGYLPEEKVLGQWFKVNLVLWLDLSTVGHSDKIQDTIDYRSVVTKVQEMVKNSPFSLVEKLANSIALTLLQGHSVLSQINVQLTKLTPPIPDFTGQITINITRHR